MSFPHSRMAPEKNVAAASDLTALQRKRHSRAPIRPKAKEARRQLGVERLEDRAMFAGDVENASFATPYLDVAEDTAGQVNTVLAGGDASEHNSGSSVAMAEGEAEGPTYDELVHLYNVQQEYGFRMHELGFFENAHGQQEKALLSKNDVFFHVRPGGGIWLTARNHTFQVQVHPFAYENPAKYLFNAKMPELQPAAVTGSEQVPVLDTASVDAVFQSRFTPALISETFAALQTEIQGVSTTLDLLRERSAELTSRLAVAEFMIASLTKQGANLETDLAVKMGQSASADLVYGQKQVDLQNALTLRDTLITARDAANQALTVCEQEYARVWQVTTPYRDALAARDAAQANFNAAKKAYDDANAASRAHRTDLTLLRARKDAKAVYDAAGKVLNNAKRELKKIPDNSSLMTQPTTQRDQARQQYAAATGSANDAATAVTFGEQELASALTAKKSALALVTETETALASNQTRSADVRTARGAFVEEQTNNLVVIDATDHYLHELNARNVVLENIHAELMRVNTLAEAAALRQASPESVIPSGIVRIGHQGGLQLSVTMENPLDHDLRLVVVPRGGALDGANFVEMPIQSGRSTVNMSAPGSKDMLPLDLVIWDPTTGRQITNRIPIAIQRNTFVEYPNHVTDVVFSDGAEAAAAVPAPVMSITLLGDTAMQIAYENPYNHDIQMVAVARNAPGGAGGFLTRTLPPGQGSVLTALPNNTHQEWDLLLWDAALRQELSPRSRFVVYYGTFSTKPENAVQTAGFASGGLDSPEMRAVFENRVLSSVRQELPPLPSARQLAHEAFPAHVGVDEDLTSQAGDMVRGAEEGIYYAYDMVQMMAIKVFQLIRARYQGGANFTARDVEAACQGMRDDKKAIVGQFVRSHMYPAQAILDIVQNNFEMYYGMHSGIVQTQNQMYSDEFWQALSASNPPNPADHIADPARIQAANAETLRIAFVNTAVNLASYSEDVRREFYEAIASAGYSLDASGNVVALEQPVFVAGESNNGEWIGTAATTYPLSIAPTGRQELEVINFTPNGVAVRTFTLHGTYMVNFSADVMGDRNVLLNIQGGGIPGGGYTTPSGVNGKSISLKLTPGNYTLTMADDTEYGTMRNGHLIEANNFTAPIAVNIKPYNSAKIEGMISIDGRPEAKRVSMSVAMFDSDGQRVNFDPVTGEPLKLNPNNPVMIVVHGRNDNPESDEMKLLAKSLSKNMQVVTIDWSEAAKDFVRLPVDFPTDGGDFGDLRDASWTPAVGQWVARQLLAAGFVASKLHGFGESHGAYVTYFMAEKVFSETGEKINSLVLLDPAYNPWFANNNISENDIKLQEVSQKSWAFISSILGSKQIADTATTFINVASGHETYVHSMLSAHRYASALIANMAERGNMATDGAGGDDDILLSQGGILVHKPDGSFDIVFDQEIVQRTGAEANIAVDFQSSTHENGDEWLQPQFVDFFLTDDGQSSSGYGG